MPAEEIRTLLRASPFIPFRLHLTDGRSFEVRHPEMAMITARVVYVSVYGHNATIPDRAESIALVHVVSAEPLPQPA